MVGGRRKFWTSDALKSHSFKEFRLRIKLKLLEISKNKQKKPAVASFKFNSCIKT